MTSRPLGSRIGEQARPSDGEGPAIAHGTRKPIDLPPLHSAPGALSGLEFADDPARRLYWRQYITLGVVITILMCITSLLYLLSTPDGLHRNWLYALVAAVIALSGVILVIGHRAVGTPRQLPFLLVWSAASISFVIMAAALDGGTTSELLWLLMLPVVYAGIGYPVRIVRGIVIAAQASVLGLMVAGDDWTGTAWYRFGFVASFNVLITRAAANRHAFETGERKMTAIATHDGLTGCLNRGAFLSLVDAECNRARRYRRPVSLLIVDVDRFKEINDTYGHQAGDRALRTLAASLQATVRTTDTVGRIGGDEFAVLLPEADAVEAAANARRLNVAARRTRGATRLTISVGAATRTGGLDDPAALIARADAALYRAKAAGRDCVVSG